MMEFRIAFIGFGVVGQGLAEILVEQKHILKERYDFDFKVVAISDTMKGSVFEAKGLDLEKLLSLVKETGKIEDYPEGIKGWDSLKTITDSTANLILEVAWTDLKTGEPAITHVKTALKNRKHVVLTNKGPIALIVRELLTLAEENNVEMRYEGTVLSGTPALNLGLYNLAGSGITKAKGTRIRIR
jgi:homoserine dehydrogenase